MATVLMPLPADGFDPSEAGIPWRHLTDAGHQVIVATPQGAPAVPDERMLMGRGLGPWRPFLQAAPAGIEACASMLMAPEFRYPIPYAEVAQCRADALLLPGGHAPGMRVYLEAAELQAVVAAYFAARKPVAAICHGVVLAARSKAADGRSVLHGRKTTALLKSQELTAWALTCLWLGRYYRTYPVTVEDEVRAALASPQDFYTGPLPLRRDEPQRLAAGFTLRDGFYLSARWPGDAHRFAAELVSMLA